MHRTLSQSVNIIKCTTSRIKVNTTTLGRPIDMAGYRSLMLLGIASSQTSGTTGAGKFHKAHVWLSAKGCSSTAGTFRICYNAFAKSSSGFAGATPNKRLFILDLPDIGDQKMRYIRPFVHGASATGFTLLAFQYNGVKPMSSAWNQSTTVAAWTVVAGLTTSRVAGGSSA